MKKPPLEIVLSVFVAFIFVQSLFFKFTNSIETIHIFSTLGDWANLAWFKEYGGYLVGIAELIASILLFSRLHGLGAAMTVGIMSGAIFFHLFTPLGIAMPEFDAAGNIVGNDSGTLFVMACLVWISGLILLVKDMKNPEGITYKLLNKGLK